MVADRSGVLRAGIAAAVRRAKTLSRAADRDRGAATDPRRDPLARSLRPLDQAAIRALDGKVGQFVAPLGVGDRPAARGVAPEKIRQFDWWQGTEIDGLRLTATPAQHFSGRSLTDGNRTLWCSGCLKTMSCGCSSAATAAISPVLPRLAPFWPFDLTLMETGAYDKRWPYVHMHPQQTVQAHRDLLGRWLLPIHNGTFDLAMHARQDPFDRYCAMPLPLACRSRRR